MLNIQLYFKETDNVEPKQVASVNKQANIQITNIFCLQVQIKKVIHLKAFLFACCVSMKASI
jgi:hypothetical protein